jgi:hypothetical protein
MTLRDGVLVSTAGNAECEASRFLMLAIAKMNYYGGGPCM